MPRAKQELEDGNSVIVLSCLCVLSPISLRLGADFIEC